MARDYAKEYKDRIERGLAAGLTRSQSRGHPGVGQLLARVQKAININPLGNPLAHRVSATGNSSIVKLFNKGSTTKDRATKDRIMGSVYNAILDYDENGDDDYDYADEGDYMEPA